MARRLSISIPWDPRNLDALMARARAADEAGIDTIWVNEGFGHDAFSGLTLLARETSRARLGTAIVNAYSRTPGALAQQYATLDQLSEGRAVIGLGSSGPGVIERFHGMLFQPSIQRLSEVMTLIKAFWRHERVTHHGAWYDIERALVMGVDPVQPEPPIYLATLHPRSVRMTAEEADGWLPAWIPFDRIAGEIEQLRAWSVEAGRPSEAVTVRAPAGGRRGPGARCGAARRATPAAGVLRRPQRGLLLSTVRPPRLRGRGGGDPPRLERRWR